MAGLDPAAAYHAARFLAAGRCKKFSPAELTVKFGDRGKTTVGGPDAHHQLRRWGRWAEATAAHAHERATRQHARHRLHAVHRHLRMVLERHRRLHDCVAVHHVQGDGAGMRRGRRDAAHRALAVEARAHHVEARKLAKRPVIAAAGRRLVQARAAPRGRVRYDELRLGDVMHWLSGNLFEKRLGELSAPERRELRELVRV